jgi:malonyl-CoA O-methyltransferase
VTEQEKKRIRQRFSRAAETYDAHAYVQKALAARLARELPTGFRPERILEVGCGTGNFTSILAGRYPDAHIVAVDFSEAMLQQARKKLGQSSNLSLVCAEGERFLETCSTPFDLICSNSTMQWFDDRGKSFANMARLLPQGGFFVGTLFGPRTFLELSQCLNQVMGRRVPLASYNFAGRIELQDILSPLFRQVSLREEDNVRRYGSLLDLLEQIRRTGTGGGLSLSGGLLTRGRLLALDDCLQKKFYGYPTTFHVFVLRCEK